MLCATSRVRQYQLRTTPSVLPQVDRKRHRDRDGDGGAPRSRTRQGDAIMSRCGAGTDGVRLRRADRAREYI
jgi:hypothetical protein